MLEEAMMNPMDVSTVSSYLLKRKVEFESDEEEDEESDGEIEERTVEKSKVNEPEVEINMLEAPEWDVDSFDGLEYYSSSELDSSSDDDKVAMEHYHINKRQIIESKGFYADPKLTPSLYFKLIRPVSSEVQFRAGRTYRAYWEEMVHLCLQKHNQDKPQDSKVEFVEFVTGPPRSKSYITFMAREKPHGPLVEYQAKCMVTFDTKRHPILCRPAPMPKS